MSEDRDPEMEKAAQRIAALRAQALQVPVWFPGLSVKDVQEAHAWLRERFSEAELAMLVEQYSPDGGSLVPGTVDDGVTYLHHMGSYALYLRAVEAGAEEGLKLIAYDAIRESNRKRREASQKGLAQARDVNRSNPNRAAAEQIIKELRAAGRPRHQVSAILRSRIGIGRSQANTYLRDYWPKK